MGVAATRVLIARGGDRRVSSLIFAVSYPLGDG